MSYLNSENQQNFLHLKQKLTDLKTAWSAMDSTTSNNYPKILSFSIMYITVYNLVFIIYRY